jgi:hypothetical protein
MVSRSVMHLYSTGLSTEQGYVDMTVLPFADPNY